MIRPYTITLDGDNDGYGSQPWKNSGYEYDVLNAGYTTWHQSFPAPGVHRRWWGTGMPYIYPTQARSVWYNDSFIMGADYTYVGYYG